MFKNCNGRSAVVAFTERSDELRGGLRQGVVSTITRVDCDHRPDQGGVFNGERRSNEGAEGMPYRYYRGNASLIKQISDVVSAILGSKP
jgi:hypothetical protein